MKNIFFNIIIPTRNHSNTLKWTIKTCLNQTYNNYKIVVSDNYSDDDTRKLVHSFNSDKIVYVNTGQRLSMSSNWEFALKYIDDGFVSILGSDDALMPNALEEINKCINDTRTSAVRTKNIVYHWPDSMYEKLKGMVYNVPLEDHYKYIDTKALLQKVSKSLKYTEDYFLDLPTLYHCFIDTKIIEKIRNTDDQVFDSSSPDMYSAVRISAEIDKHVFLNKTVIVNGLSGKSNGVSNNLFHKNNKEVKTFFEELNKPFHPSLVRKSKDLEQMISRPILVAEAFLQAGKHSSNVPEIDIKNLIEKSIENADQWNDREQYEAVMKATSEVAEINNLAEYFNNLVSNCKYSQKTSETCRSKLVYNSASNVFSFDSLDVGINNVFTLTLLLDNLNQKKKDPQFREVIRNGNWEGLKSIFYNDDFVNIELSLTSIDRYLIRQSIKKAIDDVIPSLKGVLLDIGCGKMPYRNYILSNSSIIEYIGVDIENPIYQKDIKPDLFWDGKTIPMEDNSVDAVMATELFEHLPDIQSVLTEVNRVLKPCGLLFFTVPFLWPLHDVPYDEYRYTPFALERHLKTAGLESIQINPYGGWNASLAQMIGLWLKRSGLSNEDRNNLSQQLFPFYKQLLETDVIPKSYENGPMIPGFSGTARKNALLNPIKEATFENTKRIDKEDSFKVIVIVHFFPKLTETFILDQIVGLTKQGVDVEIWAQAIPEDDLTHPAVIQYNLFSKVKYVQFPPGHLSSNQWKKEFLLSNKVDIADTDLFHVHFGQNFIAFQKLLVEINNPVIVSFHGLDASQYIAQNGPTCYNTLFSRADLITTPSYEMQKVLLSIGSNKEKMIVHRYGVDTKKFSPSVIQDENRVTKLLTVARFVEKKGIEDSLKAFAKINLDNAVYKIIGEGPLEKDLKKLVEELGINNKVIFLGPKSKEDIIKEMQNTDIYILTSVIAPNGDKEGLPVTLIEAQSAGIPVVSTYHAGIPELVSDGETGFLCKEKDVDCISEKMKILINNPDVRKKFSSNARFKVLEEFDIKKLNVNLYQSYKNIYKNYIKTLHGNSEKKDACTTNVSNSFFCPICETEAPEFLPFGVNPRPNAMCPSCGSLERQRLLWLFLKNHLNTNTGELELLHVAPENSLAKKINAMPNIRYTTIDLEANNAQLQMDVQDLKFSSNKFDIIICSHVLEHVYDDILAMNEFFRVLKPGGFVLLQVPIFQNLEKTIDGRDIKDLHERTRQFGQPDHLRAYGTDFYERIKSSDFSDIKEIKYDHLVDEKDFNRFRILNGDTIFVCYKTNRVSI